MSEYDEFENEFAVEEERGSSPFLPLAGLLVAILVLTVICAGIVWLIRGPGLGVGEGDGEDEAFNATSTAIAVINQTTEAQNAGVTATLLAMTEEASRPTATDTPEPATPTDEPTVPPTAGLTDTPVVVEVEETEEPVAEGTSIFENGGLGGTATPISGAGGGGGTGNGELPETGLGIAEALAIALGLVVVFIIARRLRTS